MKNLKFFFLIIIMFLSMATFAQQPKAAEILKEKIRQDSIMKTITNDPASMQNLMAFMISNEKAINMMAENKPMMDKLLTIAAKDSTMCQKMMSKMMENKEMHQMMMKNMKENKMKMEGNKPEDKTKHLADEDHLNHKHD